MLGPSFIKAGQVLASRPDIVREDYMNELCTLQDDVPSFPDAEVRAGSPASRHSPAAEDPQRKDFDFPRGSGAFSLILER